MLDLHRSLLSFIAKLACLLLALLVTVHCVHHSECYSWADNGTPSEVNRICSVSKLLSEQDDNSYCTGNGTFISWKSKTDDCDHKSGSCSMTCNGFIGQNLTYKCDFEGAQLYKYVNGVYKSLNGSSVNYGLLLPEHAGLYQCRDSNDNRRHDYNLTVNRNVRISGTSNLCYQFTFFPANKCCRPMGNPSPLESKLSTFDFLVYADPKDLDLNVTVEQIEWVGAGNQETRSDVELFPYSERDAVDPLLWHITFKNFPLHVTRNIPSVLMRVTAKNNYSSHAICFEGSVQVPSGEIFNIKNTSLPEHTTVSVGQNASFECAFNYTITSSDVSSVYVSFDITMEIKSENNSYSRETCSSKHGIKNTNLNLGPIRDCSFRDLFQIKPQNITIPNLYTSKTFILLIPNVTKDFNGTSVTCSLKNLDDNYLQWKRTAFLTVIDPIDSQSASENLSAIPAAILVVMAVVLVSALLAVTITVVVRKNWKRKQNRQSIEPDEVPLKRSNSSLSNCSLDSLSLSQAKTPGIQIRAQVRELNGTVGRELSEFPHCNGFTRRVVQLYDLSDFDEFVVYISYTESMSHWVRQKLKPLIEAWDPVIKVNIYEANMIPGYPIPIERLRLITEALKIVVVVSDDYSTDEYCIYELQHAIHQQPALRNGGIIPVITDFDNELPTIISNIVCVHSEEEEFEARLKQTIIQRPF